MKFSFRHIIAAAGAAMFLFGSCQKPEELIPSDVRNGINSFSVWFPEDEKKDNVFEGQIDYENNTILVVIPYTWPAESDQHLEYSDLSKMRVGATLDDNVIVRPVLLFMDLSHENTITVTNQDKSVKEYKIITEIRKSDDCSVLDFSLPDLGFKGVVNTATRNIALIADNSLVPAKAAVELAFGATITSSVDPRTTDVDYSKPEGFKFTVTAQDGVTSAEYTVLTMEPERLEKGMRHGSGKIQWAANMQSFGIKNPLNTTGMAVIKDYIVFNTIGEDLVYIDRKTGAKAGTIELPSDMKGTDVNAYATADSENSILICNMSANYPTYLPKFTIWRINGVDGTPVKYIDYDASNIHLGRRINVTGSLEGDAIITAPAFCGQNYPILSSPNAFLRWTVKGGKLNKTPEIVYMNISLQRTWNYCCDIAYLDPSDVTSDYVMASYAGWNCYTNPAYNVGFAWLDGTTNAVKHMTPEGLDGSYVPVSSDAVMFNGVGVAAFNQVNPQTYGCTDNVFMYDLSADNLDQTEWQTEAGKYGSWETNNRYNSQYRGDLALKVSEDGCFMYLYFFFTAGQVASVKFDCLDM